MLHPPQGTRTQALQGADMAKREYQKLSVLMPVYNEARTLRRIVKAVLDSPVDLEIELVCVDDHSTDDTQKILSELSLADDRIKVIRHAHNCGKGSAIRTAIEHMTGDIAVVQDADLEYDPEEFPRLLAPILEGQADAVFGSRFRLQPAAPGAAVLAQRGQPLPDVGHQHPQ
jgi:glycosyltransferase involved in cell wall biosynthesis